MLNSIVRKVVCLVALCGAITSTIAVLEASALNAKTFVENYNPLAPRLNGIFYRGSADGVTAVIKVAANGKLSGTWTTSTDRLTDTGSVKLTGSILKITKGKISSKAKCSFILSDEAKGTGTFEAFLIRFGASAAIAGSLSNAGARMT
jgi:hypothetical protein